MFQKKEKVKTPASDTGKLDNAEGPLPLKRTRIFGQHICLKIGLKTCENKQRSENYEAKMQEENPE